MLEVKNEPIKNHSIDQLLNKTETNPLYNCIRSIGISTIASYAGIGAREIVTYRKCELCERLFDSPEMMGKLQAAAVRELWKWVR